MKKVELLSPAGNYETMVGAFNAGADAVYLGGSKFGARAYADNFDKDQVLAAISYAHLYGKKIYMTVNTLVKEKEFSEIYDFMLPFAENKLDGVIVQDFGVMRFIRQEFPDVELHASTQQTVTGVYGAKLLKDLGCCRVVPARELSLQEMKAIREKADVEVEAFIHGAMCYCYSGACLFSSMVGERSGNRGRCAQPCRLPYRSSFSKNASEQYPLSLKDMCTVDMVPELIEAGIDSFKIEGRMKRPEYSAGVTALYRKYIDLYYNEPDKEHPVSKEDMEYLKALYLRSGISQGYYHKHNGREMVTLSSPAYNATSEKVLSDVKEKYLDHEMKTSCNIVCELSLGKPAVISMTAFSGDKVVKETVYGNVVEAASKRPMDKESVYKQLSRLGNTPFEAKEIEIIIDDGGSGTGIFVPVSELNELRRSLCEKITLKLSDDTKRSEICTENKYAAGNICENVNKDKQSLAKSDEGNRGAEPSLDILVNTKEQFLATLSVCEQGKKVKRVYVDSYLYLTEMTELDRKVEALKKAFCSTEFMVALPYITRTESFDGTTDLQSIMDSLSDTGFSGVLVRNLEQLGFFAREGFDKTGKKLIADYGVYCWNKEAVKLLMECKGLVSEISVPLELTIHEAKELVSALREESGIPVSINIYGKVPMMISAGCVKKTLDNCSGKLNQHNTEKIKLYDRMDNELIVTTNCRNCYNVIWNAHPTALHKKLDNIKRLGLFDRLRLDFTTENENDLRSVYEAFTGENPKADKYFDTISYTTGHYKRGVE